MRPHDTRDEPTDEPTDDPRDATDSPFPTVAASRRRAERPTTTNGDPAAPLRCPDCGVDLVALDENPLARDGVLRCRVCHARAIYADRMAEFQAAHGDKSGGERP